ncbi:MAG: DUF742 domain-containing protein [Pseudonocardia sp.]|nr:DUF742 domain-containing protein [Pseudonocardia sp.]
MNSRNDLFGGSRPDEDPGTSPRSVRPYVITGGRTRSRRNLAFETLVSAASRDTQDAVDDSMSIEERQAIELCARPRSVAEIAALLHVPIGVSRVLLGDLAERGLVVVHDSADTGGPEVLHRILFALRDL